MCGMWYVVGVPPSTETKKTYIWKKIGLHVQNLITIIGFIVNIIGQTYMTI